MLRRLPHRREDRFRLLWNCSPGLHVSRFLFKENVIEGRREFVGGFGRTDDVVQLRGQVRPTETFPIGSRVLLEGNGNGWKIFVAEKLLWIIGEERKKFLLGI